MTNINLLGLDEILCCIQEETVLLFPEKNFPRTDHFTKFCGFFMKNKDLACEEIGFQVDKLNKACTKKQSDNKQTLFFVSRVTMNTSKTMIYVTLQRANVIQTLLSNFLVVNNSKKDESSNFCNNTKVLGLINPPERSSFNNSFDSLTTMLEVRQQDKGDAHESSDELLVVCHVLKNYLKTVGTLKILLLANFCQRLLDSNTSPVFILSYLNNVQYMEQVKSSIKTLYVEENDLKEVEGISSILEKLCDSKYCLKNDKDIYIDGEKFANENSLRDFPRDIQFIQILLNEEATNIVKVAACINNFTKGKKSKILHVLFQKDYHEVLQSSLLFNILNTDSTNTFSALCNTQDVVEDWLSLRKKELWSSYKSKFGKKVQGDYWEVIISNVAIASIKLDTFSVAFTKMLDIKKVDSRNSLFIMYNYARICKLKKHYQAMVAQGIYPPIMAIQDIDFSILSLQSEWHLVMYILNYSILLSNIRTKFLSNKSQIDAHQVYEFLYNLSRNISSYYHQTKILLEPRDHLFALISARLYLSSALQQVMDDGFRLLDVNPPQEM